MPASSYFKFIACSSCRITMVTSMHHSKLELALKSPVLYYVFALKKKWAYQ